MDVPLACRCRSLRGVAKQVGPGAGNRLICMCDDCQAFAHYLGSPDDVLDPHGGTDIFQTTPSRLAITEGSDKLRCLRLSPKGLLRWYAGCCKTPLANTLATPRVPFTGVLHTFMDHSEGPSRDEALGPIRGRIQGRFATGGMPEGAHPKAPPALMLRFLRLMGGGFLRGEHKPSPFFGADGNAVAEATVVTKDERAKLRELCGPR